MKFRWLEYILFALVSLLIYKSCSANHRLILNEHHQKYKRIHNEISMEKDQMLSNKNINNCMKRYSSCKEDNKMPRSDINYEYATFLPRESIIQDTLLNNVFLKKTSHLQKDIFVPENNTKMQRKKRNLNTKNDIEEICTITRSIDPIPAGTNINIKKINKSFSFTTKSITLWEYGSEKTVIFNNVDYLLFIAKNNKNLIDQVKNVHIFFKLLTNIAGKNNTTSFLNYPEEKKMSFSRRKFEIEKNQLFLQKIVSSNNTSNFLREIVNDYINEVGDLVKIIMKFPNFNSNSINFCKIFTLRTLEIYFVEPIGAFIHFVSIKNTNSPYISETRKCINNVLFSIIDVVKKVQDYQKLNKEYYDFIELETFLNRVLVEKLDESVSVCHTMDRKLPIFSRETNSLGRGIFKKKFYDHNEENLHKIIIVIIKIKEIQNGNYTQENAYFLV